MMRGSARDDTTASGSRWLPAGVFDFLATGRFFVVSSCGALGKVHRPFGSQGKEECLCHWKANPAGLKTGATREKAGRDTPKLLFAATCLLQLRRHFLSECSISVQFISSAP